MHASAKTRRDFLKSVGLGAASTDLRRLDIREPAKCRTQNLLLLLCDDHPNGYGRYTTYDGFLAGFRRWLFGLGPFRQRGLYGLLAAFFHRRGLYGFEIAFFRRCPGFRASDD